MAMITPKPLVNTWDYDLYGCSLDSWTDMYTKALKEEFLRGPQVFRPQRLSPSEYNASVQPMTDKRVLLCA